MSQALLRQCKREVRKSLHVAAPVTPVQGRSGFSKLTHLSDGGDAETDEVTLVHKSKTGDCKSTPLVATDGENLRESDGGNAESDSKVIAASRPTTDLTNAQYCIDTARDNDVVVPAGMLHCCSGWSIGRLLLMFLAFASQSWLQRRFHVPNGRNPLLRQR